MPAIFRGPGPLLNSWAVFSLNVIPANAGRGSFANSACAGPKGNNPDAVVRCSAPLWRARMFFVSPPRASHFLKREKVTKALAPTYGSGRAGLPSHIPTHPEARPESTSLYKSGLVRHPCRPTSSTGVSLGLLKGAFGVCGCFSGRPRSKARLRAGPPRSRGKRGIVGAAHGRDSRAWRAPTGEDRCGIFADESAPAG